MQFTFLSRKWHSEKYTTLWVILAKNECELGHTQLVTEDIAEEPCRMYPKGRNKNRSLSGQSQRKSTHMKQNMAGSKRNQFSEYDFTSSWPLPLGEAIWQLPLQYIKVLIRPSVNTLRKEAGKATWRMVLVQLLGLILITVALSLLGQMIPSSALHAIAALSSDPSGLLAFLPSSLNGITLVLVSFLIGLGTAYLFSKLFSRKGTFLAHLYCLLLYTVPLVTVSGALLLIPATGWLVLVLGSIVCALFIYRMILHTFTIMAVHRLGAGLATTIVLILPMVVVLIGLFFLTQGEVLATLPYDFPWGRERRRRY